MRKYNCVLIFCIMISTNAILYAETIKAQLLSIYPSAPKVGERIVANYKLSLLNAIDDDLAISFKPSDSILIKEISTIVDDYDDTINGSNINLHTSITLTVTFISKNSGLNSIPRVDLSNNVIVFPLVYISSTLDSSNLELQSINMYVPWLELLQFLLFCVASVIMIILTKKVVCIFYNKSKVLSHRLNDIFNLLKCVRQVEKIIHQLKRMGNSSGRRKFWITVDCYRRLKIILYDRLSFFYISNEVLSTTHEELSRFILFILRNSNIDFQEVKKLFQIFDQVLYADKKFQVSERINHCRLFRKILQHTYSLGADTEAQIIFNVRESSKSLPLSIFKNGDSYVFE